MSNLNGPRCVDGRGELKVVLIFGRHLYGGEAKARRQVAIQAKLSQPRNNRGQVTAESN